MKRTGLRTCRLKFSVLKATSPRLAILQLGQFIKLMNWRVHHNSSNNPQRAPSNLPPYWAFSLYSHCMDHPNANWEKQQILVKNYGIIALIV